jgi:hypothetical protein
MVVAAAAMMAKGAACPSPARSIHTVVRRTKVASATSKTFPAGVSDVSDVSVAPRLGVSDVSDVSVTVQPACDCAAFPPFALPIAVRPSPSSSAGPALADFPQFAPPPSSKGRSTIDTLRSRAKGPGWHEPARIISAAMRRRRRPLSGQAKRVRAIRATSFIGTTIGPVRRPAERPASREPAQIISAAMRRRRKPLSGQAKRVRAIRATVFVGSTIGLVRGAARKSASHRPVRSISAVGRRRRATLQPMTTRAASLCPVTHKARQGE